MAAVWLAAITLGLAACGKSQPQQDSAPTSQPSASATGVDASPRPAVHLPDLRIPPAMFQPADGASHFSSSGTEVLGHGGDWYYVFVTPGCALPLPSGWFTEDTGAQTFFWFGGSDFFTAPYTATVLSDGYVGDTRTSADMLAALTAGATGATVVRQQVVDERRAYALLSGPSESGPRYTLHVFSKDQTKGYFHAFGAGTTTSMWADYYPLLRAMVDGWVDPSGRPLGVPLPATLPG